MRHYTVVLAVAAAALQMSACDRAPDIAGPRMLPAPQHPLSEVFHSKTNEQDFPWESQVQNCDGDLVFVTGTTHVIMTETVDSQGGFHRAWRFVSKGSGFELLTPFNLYKIDEQTGDLQSVQSPQSTFTHEQRLLVLGPKSEDNFIYHLIVKVVFPASTDPLDPQPSVMFDRSWSKCVG